MTRKKLNLAYIPNESMRKSTFNKRKTGFFKKIHELSVLCGIQACAVIYSPFTSTPEVWPSNTGVKYVLEKFEEVPQAEREKKMVNHESFLRQSIAKTRENNIKKIKDNNERAMKEAMFHFLSGKGDMLQLTDKHRADMCRSIDQTLRELYHHKNRMLNQSNLENGESSPSNAVMPQPGPILEVGSSSSNPTPDAAHTAQLLNELWAPRPIISQKQEPVDTFENDQQGYYQMMNPVGGYHQHPNLSLNLNHNQYQHQVERYAQDGMYNHQTQNQNHHVMNQPNQMGFPMMDDINRYYHHRS